MNNANRKKLLEWLMVDNEDNDEDDDELSKTIFLGDPEIMDSQDSSEIMKMLDIKKNEADNFVSPEFVDWLGEDNG